MKYIPKRPTTCPHKPPLLPLHAGRRSNIDTPWMLSCQTRILFLCLRMEIGMQRKEISPYQLIDDIKVSIIAWSFCLWGLFVGIKCRIDHSEEATAISLSLGIGK